MANLIKFPLRPIMPVVVLIQNCIGTTTNIIEEGVLEFPGSFQLACSQST
jgi:hypothetical protein